MCWAYDDPDDYRRRMLDFLADGISQGQRVSLIADAPADELIGALRGLDDVDEALTRGALQVQSLRDRYRTHALLDPADQLRAYAEATRAALAAGYTGLRVAAEATSLVRRPEQLDSFARYEHLVDRFMTGQPFSALCAYNRVELGGDTVAQIACLHPGTSAGATPFRLYAADDGTITLSGELDLTARDLLALALDRVELRPVDGELVVDARELTFADHRSLLLLAHAARRRRATAVLRTDLTGPARLIDVLDMPNVRTEPVR
ncbi:MEDS: MEthanogen/methylotroph, DcmR Sensory domain [Amycolatopsis arida]|uniref:MEDS: MEthanogen/methylotroph, DcmR Sensory domain n=1 Tax=Amycolatopsis arida TaxID=587909 RepID=A0A1I5V9E1_9PSEU|nr:DcmR-like sensory protein [Amycolatopsis arida]SFQ04109.1 MEDS: MEthanogen/methylotroph, DcmR Sensory domain [Amycolatopsis arida]